MTAGEKFYRKFLVGTLGLLAFGIGMLFAFLALSDLLAQWMGWVVIALFFIILILAFAILFRYGSHAKSLLPLIWLSRESKYLMPAIAAGNKEQSIAALQQNLLKKGYRVESDTLVMHPALLYQLKKGSRFVYAIELKNNAFTDEKLSPVYTWIQEDVDKKCKSPFLAVVVFTENILDEDEFFLTVKGWSSSGTGRFQQAVFDCASGRCYTHHAKGVLPAEQKMLKIMLKDVLGFPNGKIPKEMCNIPLSKTALQAQNDLTSFHFKTVNQENKMKWKSYMNRLSRMAPDSCELEKEDDRNGIIFVRIGRKGVCFPYCIPEYNLNLMIVCCGVEEIEWDYPLLIFRSSVSKKKFQQMGELIIQEACSAGYKEVGFDVS